MKHAHVKYLISAQRSYALRLASFFKVLLLISQFLLRPKNETNNSYNAPLVTKIDQKDCLELKSINLLSE